MLPPDAPEEGNEESIDPVAIIVDALQKKFGAGAVAAAERQRDLASDASVIRWEEIIKRLKG